MHNYYRIIAYGSLANSVNDHVWIGETKTLRCLDEFVRGVYDAFGTEYLRKPNNNDIQCLLQIGEHCGFPCMLGIIDCMHWEWKNCLVAWKCQYCYGDGSPTIILEVMESQDLWSWQAYFWVTGSTNDINVLNKSPMFKDVNET